MRQWPHLFSLALLAGCAGGGEPPSKNAVIAHTLATTVQVVAERPDGARRSGSAVLVGGESGAERRFVLTAHHVLTSAGGERLSVRLPSGPAEATVVASDPDADLALLAISGPGGPEARLQQEAYLGDEVWVVAFPWGRSRTVVKGVVSQVAAPDEEAGAPAIAGPVRLLDASISFGMSGGGVFDARTGRLLGIVRGYRAAQLSVQGSEAEPVRVPLAGETTVVSAAQIACFLSASGFAELAAAGGSSAPGC
jgi:S1-C subfamily serine protease